MGKLGYREKVVDGELYLFCTECLDYFPVHRFTLSSYVTKSGQRSYRSACKFCCSAREIRYWAERTERLNVGVSLLNS